MNEIDPPRRTSGPKLRKARDIVRPLLEANKKVSPHKLERDHPDISHVTFDMAITAELGRREGLEEIGKLPLELSEAEERLLLENSVERVINTSMRIVEKSRDEDAAVNYEDWEALKWLVVKLFNAARDQAFKRRNPG